jgi:N-methylhydantoinase A/oxoprolinase/acetone carboxylase beta subunit
MREGAMRVGVDVGGTNTDAVVLDGARVVSKVKTPTTADVTGGITTALRAALEQADRPITEIDSVMIGTTHFTNAVIERQRLQPTAIVRLGLPATQALPPMIDWPPDLRATLGEHIFLAHGGHEFDGREISPLDDAELREIARQIGAAGVRAVAIAAVFSPVNDAMERRAAELLQAAIPDVSVTRSAEIGRIGLLERESAAILNACLRDLAQVTVAAFRRAMQELALDAPLYLTQNDGTLMSAEFAERYPVLTFASGPTNSMRGAAFLSGLQDALIVDIGGTTTDIGALTHGFPREASVAVDIGGVRTNFRMPDVYSFGLGGGSLVHDTPDGPTIGPRSVGYRLTEEARVFGGAQLTATDIVVAAGQAAIGDPARVAGLDAVFVARALSVAQAMVEAGIDRMKTSAGAMPVVMVGGGSLLVTGQLAGASELIKPPHFEAANAVGAAIAQISGEVDRVFALGALTREQALQTAKDDATARAIAAGADPATIQIVDAEDIPLAYLPGNATRVRVKAVGDLA